MIRSTLLVAAAALGLSACTTAPGPVEVTRFVDQASLDRLGQGTVFVQGLSEDEATSLEFAPYVAAVARELEQLGYGESDRAAASQIAEVRVERYVLGTNGRRGPVSVGVGGSTGSYGSGVGVGIGINLGGGNRERVGTELAVTIRDASSGQSLWEGRADFLVKDNSPLAERRASAQTVAAALFSEFPGNNGETIEVEVPN